MHERSAVPRVIHFVPIPISAVTCRTNVPGIQASLSSSCSGRGSSSSGSGSTSLDHKHDGACLLKSSYQRCCLQLLGRAEGKAVPAGCVRRAMTGGEKESVRRRAGNRHDQRLLESAPTKAAADLHTSTHAGQQLSRRAWRKQPAFCFCNSLNVSELVHQQGQHLLWQGHGSDGATQLREHIRDSEPVCREAKDGCRTGRR